LKSNICGFIFSCQKAMLKLVDLKVNNDMKEVTAEIRHLESRMQLLHDKLSNEIKVVYWVIGIAMATINTICGCQKNRATHPAIAEKAMLQWLFSFHLIRQRAINFL
jgi:hypothetical protein